VSAPSPANAPDVLEPYVAPERIARIDAVLGRRIASICAVMEDVFDPHNVAACIRTCEGFGLQDVHSITNQHGHRISSTVAKSADQWIDVHRYDSTQAGVDALRAAGFAIWVSDLQADKTLDELPVQGRIALVVGNAVDGISEPMRQAADQRYILPMHGMVQSYNLSVALAISLQSTVPRRRAQLGNIGDIDPTRCHALRRRWLELSVKHPDVMRRVLEQASPSGSL